MPIILGTLQTWYNVVTSDIDKAYAIEGEIIDKCYNYGMCYMFIKNYLRITDSKVEKVNKLKELKEKIKNPLMEKNIDKL